MNHTCVARVIRQCRDHWFYGDCRSHAPQNAVLPFFENSLKCVCFCLIIALFDYHCTQILCEVEKQATCMPVSTSCLSEVRATRANDSSAIFAFFRDKTVADRQSAIGDWPNRRLVRLHVRLDFAVAATRATGFSVGDSIRLLTNAKQSC